MKMSDVAFVRILDDIKARILSGDSWEGSIAYSLMDPDLKKGEVRVVGCYRHGNLEGQGSLRIFEQDIEVGSG